VTLVLLALLVAAAGASYAYVVRERLGLVGAGLAALRWFGLALLVLLAVNPPWTGGRADRGPTVLLDHSLSMAAAGGNWSAALDTARVLAGAEGRILGFGVTPGALRDTVPHAPASLLEPALRAARAVGGTVSVVTDGELRDGAVLHPGLATGVRFVVLPRTPRPGAALTRVGVPTTAAVGDTVPLRIEITTWGDQMPDSGRIELRSGGRRLASRAVMLPASPGTAIRHLHVPASVLGPGMHAVEIQLEVPGDAERRDDRRVRIVSILDDPPAVLVADPASWDTRFLYETLAAVSGLPLRGFARITDDRWIDMATGGAVPASAVRRAVGNAALVVASGSGTMVATASGEAAVWRWRSGEADLTTGDWYVLDRLPSSPLAGRLARIEWDSVVPLTALVTGRTGAQQAVLEARLGRRGAAQPLLAIAGGDAARSLEMLATGFYRWSLRGGASTQAFRTIVSSGVDWLLRSGRRRRSAPLDVSRTVTRGQPVTFRWVATDQPESLTVRLDDGVITRTAVLSLGPDGSAELPLEPGTYRWAAEPSAQSGLLAVESYADEFVPAPITLPAEAAENVTAGRTAEYLRDRWWAFLLAIAAFVAEWAWRQRRGLP
jgi:hypothetical protein